MKEYLITIKYPMLLVAINSIMKHSIYQALPGITAVIIFNVFRTIIIAWAGWLLIKSGRSLRVTAFAGILLLFLDHPVITGGIFIIQGYYQAFYGVLISFVMFAIVAALVAAIGGLLGRFGGGDALKSVKRNAGPR